MPGRTLQAVRSAVGAYGAEKPGRRISEECRRPDKPPKTRSEAPGRELRFGRKFAGEKQRPVMRRRPNENTVHDSIADPPGQDG